MRKDGTIDRATTFSELEDVGSLRKFDNSLATQGRSLDDREVLPRTDQSTAAAKKVTPVSGARERQMGDLSLYRFYLKSVGVLFFTFWLLLAGIYVFTGKMPGNPQPSSFTSPFGFRTDTNQRYGFVSGLREILPTTDTLAAMLLGE